MLARCLSQEVDFKAVCLAQTEKLSYSAVIEMLAH